MTTILIVVILTALVTIFSVQNAAPVAVSFVVWKFEASLAVVLFLTFLSGGIVAALLIYSRRFKKTLSEKKHDTRSVHDGANQKSHG